MNEYSILPIILILAVAIVSLVSFGVYVQVITLRSLSEGNRLERESSERLKQHLISMDIYNRQANRRAEQANARQEKWFRQQDLWFKELGYTSRQILERVDEPEDEDIE